ncbi:dihydrodipicolinate synthase family protein [Devosia sp.]|uniref:dihydrodipicolinate synthase family protein n=1 Tax=Devosia sp. TaxID=1871048 RepID=UPI0035ADC8A8
MSRYPRTVLGTVCLPWRDDGSLDETIFRRTIRNLVSAGLRDLYVFGTAGEGYAVTDTLFRRVATLFAETMREAGGAPPMVGVVSLSLATMIERIEFCRSIGIDTFQFSLPNWAATSDTEMRRVFAEICGRFPDSRFLHYNLMRSGRLVRPRDYAELAERHPNLVATKYGGGDPFMISGLMTHAPQLRHFFTEQGYYLGAPLGECALLGSISTSNPARAREYLEAGASGDAVRFTKLYRELCGVLHALLDAAGTGFIDGAYDKAIHKLSEPDFPLALLPPYESTTEAIFAQYRDRLAERHPEWLPDR